MDKREKVLDKLKQEQCDDGSFGRFHTMNTKVKKKIPTTEAAAWLMYENGIDRSVEVCDKMCLYMENLLCDLQKWPDLWEKNIYFTPGVPLFVASKLALFSSKNDEYQKICKNWISLLNNAFESGNYSAEKTNEISKKLVGVEIDHSCIGLQSLNCLALYAFNLDQIPANVQEAYIHWIHNYDGKISYTNVEPKNLVYSSKSKRVISLLSRFKGFAAEYPCLGSNQNEKKEKND